MILMVNEQQGTNNPANMQPFIRGYKKSLTTNLH
jgi:hypothetical protein